MEEKELLIIQVAIKEFATYGYHKTKTEEIAKNAGVSKGLVFHYFKSKKNLYSQSVRHGIDKLTKEIDYSGLPNDSLINLFEYSLKLKFELARTHEYEMKLMFEVYASLEELPKQLKADILNFVEKTTNDSYQIIGNIVKKMPIKEEFNKEVVTKLIMMLFRQIEQETKIKMTGQKIEDMTFFDELIAEANEQMTILEKGFLK